MLITAVSCVGWMQTSAWITAISLDTFAAFSAATVTLALLALATPRLD